MGRVTRKGTSGTDGTRRQRTAPKQGVEEVVMAIQASPKLAGKARQEGQEEQQEQQEGPIPQTKDAIAPSDVPPTAHTRREIGDALYGLNDVPQELKLLAQHYFGRPIRMATPRENGGPYRGRILNTERYLIQEVSARSVVFHVKDRMELVSDRLRWMDANQMLSGADVQIGYDGDRPRVFPWDRLRDQFERTVASLKMSAREIGLSASLDSTLDQLQASSWIRIQQARAGALAQSRQQTARDTTPDSSREGPEAP
jgi:putative DNA primase/helicase